MKNNQAETQKPIENTQIGSETLGKPGLGTPLTPVETPKKKPVFLIIGIVLGIAIIGFVVYKATAKPATKEETKVESTLDETLPEVDKSVRVDLSKSNTKDNTVVLNVEGLNKEYVSIAYELSYSTQGVVQGVTSKPVDVTGKDMFLRDDIYLGTCSKNVCKPHTGIKTITVVLEFTKTDGKKYSFTKDYDLN